MKKDAKNSKNDEEELLNINEQIPPVVKDSSEKENIIIERYLKKVVIKEDCFALTYLVEDLKNRNEKM